MFNLNKNSRQVTVKKVGDISDEEKYANLVNMRTRKGRFLTQLDNRLSAYYSFINEAVVTETYAATLLDFARAKESFKGGDMRLYHEISDAYSMLRPMLNSLDEWDNEDDVRVVYKHLVSKHPAILTFEDRTLIVLKAVEVFTPNDFKDLDHLDLWERFTWFTSKTQIQLYSKINFSAFSTRELESLVETNPFFRDTSDWGVFRTINDYAESKRFAGDLLEKGKTSKPVFDAFMVDLVKKYKKQYPDFEELPHSIVFEII